MRKLIPFLVCLMAAMVIVSCYQDGAAKKNVEHAEAGWKLAYRHDENGSAMGGCLDSLLMGIRNGYDVRIGWGWQRQIGDSMLTLEHVAEPLYLSIIQGENVSAIIDPHPLLKSYINIDLQHFGEGGHIWQCIMSTKGTFNAQVYDRSTGKLIKDWPQNHKMSWFLEYPLNHTTVNKTLY